MTIGPQAVHRIGIPAIVNADVHGAWSRTLEVRSRGGEPGWALISPQGAVTWRHEGRVSSDTLKQGARHVPAHQPRRVVRFRPAARDRDRLQGDHRAGSELLRLRPIEVPAVPAHTRSHQRLDVTFAERSASSSHAHLRQFYADYGQRGEAARLVVVVVEGADARQAAALRRALGIDSVTIPDPARTIADRLGVSTWPTT